MTQKYAHADALVSTDWVAQHQADPSVRIVEVDVDTSAYEQGHVPDAVGWSWKTQLSDTVQRDILSKRAFEQLMSESGIDADTTVVLYGDNNNWFAAWAFWQMKIYGHRNVRIMDGGRKKWEAEQRPLVTDAPNITPATYAARDQDLTLRALLPDVQQSVNANGVELVDVRSPQEFSGELLAPPGLPETCQRGGHIPGARNIPWSSTCNEDGTFKSAGEIRKIYETAGITGAKPIITYCRIGERSSHSWFVLRYLLGHEDVKNYDGSWTEWGNLVGAPVEKDA